MLFSRRNFLRAFGVSVAAGAVSQAPLAAALPFPLESTRTRKPGGPIRLNSNENAYGPSPKVLATMRDALSMVNRYPYKEYDRLLDQIAALHKVTRNQILLGCGSSEILRVCAAAFLGPGKKLVQASPTFELLGEHAEAQGAEVVGVRLNPEFAHDLPQMLARSDDSTGLVYICNPNNPTGSVTSRKNIEAFLKKLPEQTRVIIDEAYYHYADDTVRAASFLDRPMKDDRIIVCRTFSKVFGLAGLRVGYGIATPEVIAKLRPFITSGSVNEIAALAAVSALRDNESVLEFARRNDDDRQEFFNQAQGRMLKPISSQTNFFMMNVHQPADAVINHFEKHGVLIGRHFPPLDTYIRVSLAKPEEMIEFWRVWDQLPKTGKMDM